MQFNLQSRLEAARDARRRQVAGELPPAPEPEAAPLEDDSAVIDLRTIRSMRQAAAESDPSGDAWVWNGSPRSSVELLLRRRAQQREEAVPTTDPLRERCPACGGSVRLDVFDTITALAHLTCLDCGLLFTARSPRA